MARTEPPDSGVGSLESPKHPAKEQQQEAAPPPTAPTPAPKTGPQPLRAMEPFGGEGVDPPATPARPRPEAEASGSHFRFVSAKIVSASYLIFYRLICFFVVYEGCFTSLISVLLSCTSENHLQGKAL